MRCFPRTAYRQFYAGYVNRWLVLGASSPMISAMNDSRKGPPMPRQRAVPDAVVFSALRHILATEGAGAASFRAVGRAAGLAAATLVQRYGSAEGMLVAAMVDGWDHADASLAAAATQAPKSDKGATVLLKALPPTPPLLPQSLLQERAANWQRQVIKELTLRLKDGQAAAIMFAAWQGRLMWEQAGARGFALKDLLRRLT
jgi:AcrR family transcriptional regulator